MYIFQKSCSEKLDWYKQTTDKLKGYYDLYYLSYHNQKLNTIQSREIEAKHEQFENMIKESLKKYEEDKKKFFDISKDSLQAVSFDIFKYSKLHRFATIHRNHYTDYFSNHIYTKIIFTAHINGMRYCIYIKINLFRACSIKSHFISHCRPYV